MNELSEKQRVRIAKAVARSWSDEAYKAKLLNDPRGALAEVGVEVPDDVTVNVTEQKSDEFNLVLPPNPGLQEGPVSDDQLQAVAGGFCSCCWDWDGPGGGRGPV